MSRKRVLIEYEVDAGGAVREVQRVDAAMASSGRTAEQATLGVRRMAAAFAALGAAVAAAKIGQFLSESVRESAEQQKIFTQLAQSMKNVGVAYNGVSGELQALLGHLQKITVYGDTESATALQKLISITGSYQAALRLLEPTMDTAAAMGIDLATASELVGRAVAGNLGSLSRYGIVLDDTVKKQMQQASTAQRAAMMAELLNAKFGGSAQAELATYAGRVKQLTNYWGDLKEALGDVVTQAAASPGMFETLTSSIVGLRQRVIDFGEALVFLVNLHPWDVIKTEALSMVSVVLHALVKFTAAIRKTPVLEKFGTIFGLNAAAARTLSTWVDSMLDKVVAATSGFASASAAASEFRTRVENLSNAASAAASGGVRDLTDTTGDLEDATDDVIVKLDEAGTTLTAVAQGSLQDWRTEIVQAIADQADLADGTNDVAAAAVNMADIATNAMDNIRRGFGDVLTRLFSGDFKDAEDAWRALWQSFARVMSDELSKAFEEVLNSLFSGGAGGGAKGSVKKPGLGAKLLAGGAGVAGIYSAYQQGGTMGALTGALSGATAGFVLGGPIGAAIGGVAGLLAGLFGGQDKPPTPTVNWAWAPGTGASATGTGIPSGATTTEFTKKINSVVRNVYGGFLDALAAFGWSDLFDQVHLTGLNGPTMHTKDLAAVMQEMLDAWIPGQIQNQVASPFYQGFYRLGASQGWIDKIFGQANQLGAEERVQYLVSIVHALVGINDAISSMNWTTLSGDAVKNSMEAFGDGFAKIVDQIELYRARMDAELDLGAQAKDLQKIGELARSARQAEIQMLQQIDQLQKGINASIEAQIEGLRTGGMSKQQKIAYYQQKYQGLIGQLAAASSPEEVQTIVQQIQDTISQLTTAYGDQLYGGGRPGYATSGTPAAQLEQMLRTAQDLANSALQSMRDEIRQRNDDLLAALGDAKDKFLDLGATTADITVAANDTGATMQTLTTSAQDAGAALADLAAAARGLLGDGEPRLGTGVYRALPGDGDGAETAMSWLQIIIAEIIDSRMHRTLAIG